MAFQQLYYTSCEHGLGGYGGYQFNAVTPGVPPAVLREVEERSVYEPPRWLTGPGPDEPEAYPVAFSYGISEATGADHRRAARCSPGLTTRAVPVTTSCTPWSRARPSRTSGRCSRPNCGGRRCGRAPGRRYRAAGTARPAAARRHRPAGRPGVPRRPRGGGVLPELLTAVGRAMAGDRPVLVVSQDVTENAWWIAAVSYLLGEHLAHQMTFTTYSHRPGYSRYHLDRDPARHAARRRRARASRSFDFTAGRTPDEDVHPLAAMLVSTGVMACPGLWQQAAAFASGTETEPGRLARAGRRGGRPARQEAVPRRGRRGGRVAVRARPTMRARSSPTSAWASRWPSQAGRSLTSG